MSFARAYPDRSILLQTRPLLLAKEPIQPSVTFTTILKNMDWEKQTRILMLITVPDKTKIIIFCGTWHRGL